MSILDFWDNAADGVYDRFVLGTDAPYEIRRLLAQEDRELTGVIESYFATGHDVVFIEIGSGTGRYIRLFGKLIFTNELYRKHLSYIVGTDFSMNMIETSAHTLVSSTTLHKNKTLSLITELKTITGLPSKDILATLSKRFQLLHADATKPFLEASNAKIVVGIMFGTLGNIPDAAAVISNVKSLVHNEGIVIVTVFNSEAIDVGFKAYSELTKRGFTNLAPLRWDPDNSVFTSDLGFYSRWYSFQEIKTLIESNLETKADIIPLASQGLLAKATLSSVPKTSQPSRNQNEYPTLKVLCPNCGNPISVVPVTDKKLLCDRCARDYAVTTIKPLCIPSLFPSSFKD